MMMVFNGILKPWSDYEYQLTTNADEKTNKTAIANSQCIITETSIIIQHQQSVNIAVNKYFSIIKYSL